ncbi:putative protein kinase domain, leucine-rich repeat domain superfamily [Plasmopara halstedii]
MIRCCQSHKRRTSRLSGFPTILLLFFQSATGYACEMATSTLSTSCSNVCQQYEPCLVYNACPSGVSCISANECVVQCFVKPASDPTTFTFLVNFGSYKSNQEIAKAQNDTKFFKELQVLPNDTTTFATANNDVMTIIKMIELQPSVTSFVLVGGSSINSSVKSKVANVTFVSDSMTINSRVTSVKLNNLDLSNEATLEQLPSVFPPTIQTLSLTNTLLYAFPPVMATFTNLQTLSINDNRLTSFRAVFPNLATLDLSLNHLTEIPASIFIHDKLTALQIKGNPLVAPWFTQAQIGFLNALTNLDINNADFFQSIDTCHSADRRQVHLLTVCISDARRNDEISSLSSAMVIVGAFLGGVCLLGIFIIIGICVHRSRVRKHTSRRSISVRETYFGGLAPPLTLTRSPVVKGYRGGRRTPANGGPRFCPDYEYDDVSNSPRISTRSTHSNQSYSAYSVWNDEELLSLQVKYDEIEDVGTISSGAFGIIWLVKYRGSQLLASKRLRVDQITKQRTQAFIEEIKMAAPFDHPNIVRLVGCAWTIESDLQALFEYMENGDLRDYLINPTSPRHWSQELLQLAVDIIEALVYVHSFTPPLIHRDLKSRNVLLTGEMTAKVTDFGASRYKSVDETMTAAVGTGRWLAPEVIQGSNKYDQSVDIYAFGIVLSELDTHAIPYEDVRGPTGNRLNDIAILQLVAVGELRPRFGANCPPDLRLLADRCLAQDPTNRPPAHMVAYDLRVIQRSLYTLL